MYPNDEIANLNAAISEMQHNDMTRAQRHLDKAGNSPEAIYARGILEAHLKQYNKALELLRQAQEQGIAQAQNAIEQINLLK